MSFRRRLTIVVAAAVAVVIALVAGATWVIARNQLRSQVDATLRAASQDISVPLSSAEKRRFNNVRLQASTLPFSLHIFRLPKAEKAHEEAATEAESRVQNGTGAQPANQTFLPTDILGVTNVLAQVIDDSGKIIYTQQSLNTFPVDSEAVAVAQGRERATFTDAYDDGAHYRIYTAPTGPQRAIQVARRVNELDHNLYSLALVLLGVGLSGILIAAFLGWAVALAALRPVRRLTAEAEQVAGTRDLTQRMYVSGHDELSRLARTLNMMLDALDESLSAQRQLVADASHELRTPLTSLRTNVEVLTSSRSLDADDRQSLIRDVIAQIDEFTGLVNDLVDLARGNEPVQHSTELRLDEVVEEAVTRARLHLGDHFHAQLAPCLVSGDRERLHRAIGNLLENAVKYGGSAQPVEVSVAHGSVIVRDHGPGIAAKDVSQIFERFYRASTARGQPGSGLGLAIVRQVADSHSGSVVARNAEGGGAEFEFSLPERDPIVETDADSNNNASSATSSGGGGTTTTSR